MESIIIMIMMIKKKQIIIVGAFQSTQGCLTDKRTIAENYNSTDNRKRNRNRAVAKLNVLIINIQYQWVDERKEQEDKHLGLQGVGSFEEVCLEV